MKVRDLISQNIDVDVYDDVCEALAIAFCGPLKLTEEGKAQFGDVLSYEIELVNGLGGMVNVIVKVDDPEEKTWKERLKKAKAFFESAAGYCADEDFKKWFEEG